MAKGYASNESSSETPVKLRIYKTLSLLLLLDIIAIVFFLTIWDITGVLVSVSLFVMFLALQVIIVKCPNCGTRPGLWLLAIWSLLLDFEFYFADTVLLRKCPKCDFALDQALKRKGIKDREMEKGQSKI